MLTDRGKKISGHKREQHRQEKSVKDNRTSAPLFIDRL